MSNGAEPFDLASLITAHDEGNFADAVVPPIFQTSLFTFSDYDDMVARINPGTANRILMS